MNKSIYNDYAKASAPMSNEFAQWLQSFNQFRQSFRGNPKDEVQRLLNSGQMTQAQFNQLSQMTNEIMRMMK